MSPRPVLVYNADSPAAKGARIERRIEEARALRASRTSEPALIPAVLSPSSLNEFLVCETRWFYRKILELPERRSAHAALGSAVHAAVTENARQKMHTREDLPVTGAVALFRDAWSREADAATFEKTDNPADMKEAGEIMTRLYIERAAPAIEPAAVEKRVAGEIGGVAVQGYIDILDVTGTIIDVKTGKRATAEPPAGYRNQVATYAMLEPAASGKARLDTLTKGKTVDLKPATIQITASDRHHTTRLYQIAREKMASGVYIPNRGATLCSRKYCSHWERCVSEYGGEVRR